VQAIVPRRVGSELGNWLQQRALPERVDYRPFLSEGGAGRCARGEVVAAASVMMMMMTSSTERSPRRIPHEDGPVVANSYKSPRVVRNVHSLNGNNALLVNIPIKLG
jgi:hypothetical protein